MVEETVEIDVDSIISRLLSVIGYFFPDIFNKSSPTIRSKPGKTVDLKEGEILALIKKAQEIFLAQPIVLDLAAPVTVCGIIAHFFGPENNRPR